MTHIERRILNGAIAINVVIWFVAAWRVFG
jgi:hypothetical protein